MKTLTQEALINTIAMLKTAGSLLRAARTNTDREKGSSIAPYRNKGEQEGKGLGFLNR